MTDAAGEDSEEDIGLKLKELLDEANNLYDNTAKLVGRTGQHWKSRNRFEQVIAICDEALEKGGEETCGTYPKVFLQLQARSYDKLQQYATGIEVYERILQLLEDESAVLQAREQTAVADSRLPRMKAKLQIETVEWRYNFARALTIHGPKDIVLLKRAIELNEKNYTVKDQLEKRMFHLVSISLAYDRYKLARRTDPTGLKRLQFLLDAAQISKNSLDQLETEQRGINPTDMLLQARNNYGVIVHRLRQYSAATAVFMRNFAWLAYKENLTKEQQEYKLIAHRCLATYLEMRANGDAKISKAMDRAIEETLPGQAESSSPGIGTSSSRSTSGHDTSRTGKSSSPFTSKVDTRTLRPRSTSAQPSLDFSAGLLPPTEVKAAIGRRASHTSLEVPHITTSESDNERTSNIKRGRGLSNSAYVNAQGQSSNVLPISSTLRQDLQRSGVSLSPIQPTPDDFIDTSTPRSPVLRGRGASLSVPGQSRSRSASGSADPSSSRSTKPSLADPQGKQRAVSREVSLTRRPEVVATNAQEYVDRTRRVSNSDADRPSDVSSAPSTLQVPGLSRSRSQSTQKSSTSSQMSKRRSSDDHQRTFSSSAPGSANAGPQSIKKPFTLGGTSTAIDSNGLGKTPSSLRAEHTNKIRPKSAEFRSDAILELRPPEMQRPRRLSTGDRQNGRAAAVAIESELAEPVFESAELLGANSLDSTSAHWFKMLRFWTHRSLMGYHELRQRGHLDRPRVKVAILDSGLDRTRQDIIEDFTLHPGRFMDFKDFTDDALEDRLQNEEDKFKHWHDADPQQHGTNCASLLARVAVNAEIYIAKVVPRPQQVGKRRKAVPSPRALCKALEHINTVWKDVDIISLSCGFEEAFGRLGEFETAISLLAVKKLVIVAAPNQRFEGPANMIVPAFLPGVLTINAFRPSLVRSGVELYDTEANIIFPGERVAILDINNQAMQVSPVDVTGTSFATPLAAGTAALVLDLLLYADYGKDDPFYKLLLKAKWMKSVYKNTSVEQAQNQLCYLVKPWLKLGKLEASLLRPSDVVPGANPVRQYLGLANILILLQSH